LDTDQASCLVKLTCDPGTFPLSGESLSALLNSAGVRVAASRKVFHDPVAGGVVQFEIVADASGPSESAAPLMPGGFGGYGGGGFGGAASQETVPSSVLGAPARTILGSISVFPGERAIEYLQAVCERLETALVNTGERERELLEGRLQNARMEVELASKRYQELQAMRREFTESAGRADLSREAIVDQVRHLEQERLDLEMQQVSRQARREAIEKRIAHIRELPDPRGRAAAEMLKAAESQLEALREKHKRLSVLWEKGTVSQEEVQDVKALIAQAEAQVAEATGRLEEISSGGERVAELNQHLAEQAIEEAEMQARLRWLEERLARTRGALELADEYERTIEIELPLAREAYEQSRIMVAELERRKRLAQTPAVMVLGE
jgi:uncharacterized coiled-coil protein SlyX